MEFAQIFTQMSWLPAILLCGGMVFLVVEMFVPGFGFFGITGSIAMIAGVVVRIVDGLDVTQSLILVLLILGFFIVAGMFITFSAQHGFLGKTGLFETKSTLDKDYDKVEKELRKLVGKSGKTVGVLNLGGKAKINGKIYDVISVNSFVESGAHIKVIAIKDHHIMVRKWFE